MSATLPLWLHFFSTVDRGKLTRRLEAFPGAILVGGCQRSGTTALSEAIAESEGIRRHWSDAGMGELATARILAGLDPCEPGGRYCFQTTYLGPQVDYARQPGSFHVIWVMRNPYSTVRSLVYNWPAPALDETFERDVVPTLSRAARWKVRLRGTAGVSPLEKACLHYRSKLEQMVRLAETLSTQRFMMVDYDELVGNVDEVLPAIFAFVGLSYRPRYGQRLHRDSLQKRDSLTSAERRVVERLCGTIYREARRVAHQSGRILPRPHQLLS